MLLEISYVTPDGLSRLKQELIHLREERLPEIIGRIKAALVQADGDASENVEYDHWLRERQLAEARVAELEDTIKYSRVIDEAGPCDAVRVGSKVTIKGENWDEPEQYRIVGKHEVDPLEGLISHVSPVGQALIGAKVGDAVSAETPRGMQTLHIIAID